MNSKGLKLENTKALIQMHKENKISFGECIRKISIIGDLDLLDQYLMDNGEIELKNNYTEYEKNA